MLYITGRQFLAVASILLLSIAFSPIPSLKYFSPPYWLAGVGSDPYDYGGFPGLHLLWSFYVFCRGSSWLLTFALAFLQLFIVFKSAPFVVYACAPFGAAFSGCAAYGIGFLVVLEVWEVGDGYSG